MRKLGGGKNTENYSNQMPNRENCVRMHVEISHLPHYLLLVCKLSDTVETFLAIFSVYINVKIHNGTKISHCF